MNIILYSCNEDVLTRWQEIVSAGYTSVESYNNITELDYDSTMKAENSILLYQLSGIKGEEEWLKDFQQRHHEYLFIIALSNTPDPHKGVRLLDFGIKGFANTYSSNEKLLMAINVVNKGEIWLGDALINYILTYLKREISIEEIGEEESDDSSADIIFQKLTAREQQIAQKVLLGKQNKLIADDLGITERTVKTHLSSIYRKAEVRNRLELSLVLQKIDRRGSKQRVDRRRVI